MILRNGISIKRPGLIRAAMRRIEKKPGSLYMNAWKAIFGKAAAEELNVCSTACCFAGHIIEEEARLKGYKVRWSDRQAVCQPNTFWGEPVGHSYARVSLRTADGTLVAKGEPGAVAQKLLGLVCDLDLFGSMTASAVTDHLPRLKERINRILPGVLPR